MAGRASSILATNQRGAHRCQILERSAPEALRHLEAPHPLEIFLVKHALLPDNVHSRLFQELDEIAFPQAILGIEPAGYDRIEIPVRVFQIGQPPEALIDVRVGIDIALIGSVKSNSAGTHQPPGNVQKK